MREKKLLPVLLLFLFFSGFFIKTASAEFKIEKITNRIMTMINTIDGSRQNIILSKKGMVVLGSFWSSVTAERFKKQWVEKLKREDFVYNINTVDRLDLFGGNSVYKDITIIGHESFLTKFKKKIVDAEIKRLIKMWRWKEDISRKRLATHKPGSEKEKGEKRWLNTCKNRADELEKGFSLVLPNKVYKNEMKLNLGDLTLHLIYFGKAGYDGMTLIMVPEEKTVFIPGFILHPQHLAPGSNNSSAILDVPRWIKVLDMVLNGKVPVKTVVCGIGAVWTRERALTHLNYIKKLWNRVKILEKEGKELQDIQKICSIDNEFSFVKDIQVYKDKGDKWVRPQHRNHIRSFFLQHKQLASKLIKKEAEKTSLESAIANIYKMKETDKSLYFDESDLNNYGYKLINSEKIDDAILIFKFNVKIFPKSGNAFDSLAEAYMKKGDNKQAIRYCEISLKLNPKNSNAIKMLEKLRK